MGTETGNESDGGTFVVPRTKLYEAWLRGLRSGPEVLPPSITSPDAFTPHGGEHALDRWADDGGRA